MPPIPPAPAEELALWLELDIPVEEPLAEPVWSLVGAPQAAERRHEVIAAKRRCVCM
jgi:hypothetical protein